jgi:cob(I)alamin adenosyltransferase
MSVTTRRGDEGMTDTFDGRRVSKDSLDIELMGSLDEINSAIGFAKALMSADRFESREALHYRQKDIMSLMGVFCTPSTLENAVARLLAQLDGEVEALDSLTAEMSGFVIPGETPAEGALHVARTVCRRSERLAVRKAEENLSYQPLVRYLNRLSDVLFLYSLRERNGRRPA